MVIYPVDRAILCLNNRVLMKMEFGEEFEFEFSFTLNAPQKLQLPCLCKS